MQCQWAGGSLNICNNLARRVGDYIIDALLGVGLNRVVNNHLVAEARRARSRK